MTDTKPRQAEFIGRLFYNTSKTGKKYFKGTINGEEVYGHITKKEDKNNPGSTYTMVSLEKMAAKPEPVETKPQVDDVF